MLQNEGMHERSYPLLPASGATRIPRQSSSVAGVALTVTLHRSDALLLNSIHVAASPAPAAATTKGAPSRSARYSCGCNTFASVVCTASRPSWSVIQTCLGSSAVVGAPLAVDVPSSLRFPPIAGPVDARQFADRVHRDSPPVGGVSVKRDPHLGQSGSCGLDHERLPVQICPVSSGTQDVRIAGVRLPRSRGRVNACRFTS